MSDNLSLIPVPAPANTGDYAMIERATDDDQIVALWLATQRSDHTKRQYLCQWQRFRDAVGVPLQAVTLAALAAWVDQVSGSANTRKVAINAVKSLFSFAHKTGYVRVNPGVMIRPPAAPDTKHTRLLSESDVHALIAHARTQRTKVLIRVLYSSGARVSEVLALTWADLMPVTGGRAVLMILAGKGGKQREAMISAETCKALIVLRGDAGEDAPIFAGRGGRPMDRVVAFRVIQDAAQRAGIERIVSPHSLRHAHVSHAMARGASVETIRAQTGHSDYKMIVTYAHSEQSSSDYLSV